MAAQWGLLSPTTIAETAKQAVGETVPINSKYTRGREW